MIYSLPSRRPFRLLQASGIVTSGSAGDTWRHLAGELGYQPEHIDSFTHEACPARALLASWAAQDSATLDTLLAALRRIQRADIVESLCSESTATSPV